MPKGHPGEMNCRAKLTALDVIAIRTSPDDARTLAARYGVHVDTIGNIRRRETWAHIDDPLDVPPSPYGKWERWRPVPDDRFSALYEVSDFGQIRRIRQAYLPSPPHRGMKISRQGYTLVVLCANGVRANPFLHRLVTGAFLGPCPKGQQVNHKNGQKSDNRLANLEYVTPAENIRHASKHRLMPFGERNNKAKLTEAQVRAILNDTRPAHAVAHAYGVHLGTIHRIRQRKGWAHLHDVPFSASK